jgi:hypothetical protein
MEPSFVEDINNLLNSGEVPNLFPSDEKAECLENARVFAKQDFGKMALDMNSAQLWSYFVGRVRAKLHIVLAFSPIGSEFRDRLRKYPSLINCCAIDWFTAWPADALVAVAQKFLADVAIIPSSPEADDTETIRGMCCAFAFAFCYVLILSLGTGAFVCINHCLWVLFAICVEDCCFMYPFVTNAFCFM